MDYASFKTWRKEKGLLTNAALAQVLLVSPQTIRNWDSKQAIPFWVQYAVLAIDAHAEPLSRTVSGIKDWQRANGFKTYEDTARCFQLKRQTVHQWFSRGAFPKWLSLACPGYDIAQATGENEELENR